MRNNKGFTLIEILAAVVILSILAITTFLGYSKYIETSRQKSYDNLARSASNAASEYSMDYLGVESVTLRELYEEQYLEYPQDPGNNGKMCSGKVIITQKHNPGGLDTEEYDVLLCCSSYNYKYHFPGGKKTKLKPEEIVKDEPKPSSNSNSTSDDETTPEINEEEEPTSQTNEGEEQNEQQGNEESGEDEDE